ncbi:MAG: glycosyltransferase family 4 protein [Longimicrobiales bacterium]|nr:glycosyltransferase family 4 protein [Longimicrobiales bacterium]
MSRRLLTLSLGDWESSIVERSALGRLQATSAIGYFDEVEHLFFRTTRPRVEEPVPGLRVRDISGTPHVRVGGPAKLAAFARGAHEILRIARDFRPHAVQVVDPFQSGLLGLRVRKELGIPLVVALVSHYDNSRQVSGRWPAQWMPESMAFRVHDRVLRSADLILTHCDYYARYAVERGAARARIHVHPLWSESAFHEAEPDPGILARHRIDDPSPLLYVGRLHPVKYSDELLAAYLRIRERYPRKRLIVLGGAGPLRESFEAGLREAGARDDVLIRQVNSAAEMKSWMAAAGVMMAPHAGYALLEAGLAGAPVVAYDFEWHPEVITDGETGRLVPFRDWRAMAATTIELLDDPGEARRLGDALRRRVETEHSHARVQASIRGAFRRLLEGSGAVE